jgi:hypothetical protein
MAYTYHIAKDQNIQGTVKTIYYEGDYKWSTNFGSRKKYTNKSVATSEIYSFGGTVVTE